jgi:endo-1,4-beta-D-glucanase Y
MLIHKSKKSRTIISVVFLCFVFTSCHASVALKPGPYKPFPNHTVYAKGSIKPNRDSQAEMDSITARFYRLWKKHYIARIPAKKECYVYCNADGNWGGGNKSPTSLSVSEGHGYGMIITAIMAGYDPESQTLFDAMLVYFKSHPSSINRGLMAWNQSPDTTRTEHNSDDATDGDLDIAYALILADKQWGSNGRYNYIQDAINIIDSLKKTNINHELGLVLMGDFTEKGEKFYSNSRSSDLMPAHFKAFAKATGDTEWTNVCNKSYSLLAYMQKHYSPNSGLFPDFIQNCNTVPKPARPYLMENPRDGTYSYNACRVPWRLGCDYLVNGDERAKKILTPINSWIIKSAKNDPYKIKDGYTLGGKPTPGASGDNIAFIGPFGVGAMTDAKNQIWLNRIWDYASKEPMSDEEYYGNTLKLMCMIVMSGNWW